MTPTELLAAVHAQALGYPDAYEEEPWGHPAIKVRKKAFVFCSALGSDPASISVKLPTSAARAREQADVVPTGYGLGRHGWCSIRLTGAVALEQLLDWVDESYRAVAPKTLVKRLGPDRPPPAIPATPAPDLADEVPRVLIVGAGPRRRERASVALADQQIPAVAVDLEGALDVAGELQPEVVVVDLGRQASQARPLLEDLRLVCPDAVVLGARATGAEARGADRAAAPPGDPLVVDQVRRRLQR